MFIKALRFFIRKEIPQLLKLGFRLKLSFSQMRESNKIYATPNSRHKIS